MANAADFGSVFSAAALAQNPFAPIQPASDTTSSTSIPYLPLNPIDAIVHGAGSILSGGQGIMQGVKNVSAFADFISSIGGWQRIGLVVGGFVLVIAGLFMLGRGPQIVQQVVKSAAVAGV